MPGRPSCSTPNLPAFLGASYTHARTHTHTDTLSHSHTLPLPKEFIIFRSREQWAACRGRGSCFVGVRPGTRGSTSLLSNTKSPWEGALSSLDTEVSAGPWCEVSGPWRQSLPWFLRLACSPPGLRVGGQVGEDHVLVGLVGGWG